MIIDVALNFHMQAESTEISSGRLAESTVVNSLKCENNNTSSSETYVTRGYAIACKMDERLISQKYTDTISDMKTAL
jgi:hypothetical protein